jgi:hypothetical protein
VEVGMAMGRGADRFCLPHPHSLLPTGMRNWISSPSPMGSSIPAPSPSPHWINFLIKKSFLSFNGNVVMHYPTICAHFNISLPNNSVAPLTINESSYIMTIIKPNNITYQYQPPQKKKTWPFYIRVGFGYGFGAGTYIPVTRPIPVF